MNKEEMKKLANECTEKATSKDIHKAVNYYEDDDYIIEIKQQNDEIREIWKNIII